jgi:DHA1 family tetracycline resistance protein-like MFS transporter
VNWHLANPFGSLALLRSSPVLLGLAGALLLYQLAHDSLPSVYVLYATYRYAWTERDVGLSLAVVGVCSTVVQAAMIGPMVKRFGERKALLLGLLFGVVGFGVYGIATTGALFLVGIPFMALWGLAGPSMQALMSHKVSAEEQGRLQGAMSSVMGITGMLAPLLFTQVLRGAIDEGHAAYLPGAPFVLAAVLLGLSFLWSLRVAR